MADIRECTRNARECRCADAAGARASPATERLQEQALGDGEDEHHWCRDQHRARHQWWQFVESS